MRREVRITRYPEEFGQHRYRLTVEFTDQEHEFDRGNLVVVLFNPATIREEDDLLVKSQTRRRLINLARDGKYRTMTELELFANRSRKKKDLVSAVQERGADPVGPFQRGADPVGPRTTKSFPKPSRKRTNSSLPGVRYPDTPYLPGDSTRSRPC